MVLNNSIRIFLKASAYFIVSGAILTSYAASKKPGKLDATPAPRARSTGDLNVHSVGLGIGQTFLYSQFNEFGDDKITIDLYYTYSASHSFDFIANFHTQSHEFKVGKTSLSGLALGIKAKAYNIDNFSPFVIAGLGFYSPRVTRPVGSDVVSTESTAKLTFGVHFGAGAQLKLNKKFAIGVLGHYHDPFDVKQDYGPKVEGNYFKLLMTSFYSF